MQPIAGVPMATWVTCLGLHQEESPAPGDMPLRSVANQPGLENQEPETKASWESGHT